MDLYLKVKNNLHKYISKNNRVLVCVSGGPDSVALLHVLNRLSGKNKFRIFAAHFDHRLRGKESLKDAALVKKLCGELGVELVSSGKNIKSAIKKSKSGPEKTARDERYRFFIDAALRLKADRIAIGHNRDDNAETVLFRLVRGAGTAGLSGIPGKRLIKDGDFGRKVKNKLYIVRPLIEAFKKDIIEYLKQNRVKFRTDSSNRRNVYDRNKIRNQLIPTIEKMFNKSFKDTLASVADIASGENEYIESALAGMCKKLVLKKGGKITCRADKLVNLHRALRIRIIRNMLRQAFTHHRNITYNLINDIDRIAFSQGSINLPEGYVCTSKKGRIVIQ